MGGHPGERRMSGTGTRLSTDDDRQTDPSSPWPLFPTLPVLEDAASAVFGGEPACFWADSCARAWEGVWATVTGGGCWGAGWDGWWLCFLLEKKDILRGRPGFCGDCFEEKSGIVGRVKNTSMRSHNTRVLLFGFVLHGNHI